MDKNVIEIQMKMLLIKEQKKLEQGTRDSQKLIEKSDS